MRLSLHSYLFPSLTALLILSSCGDDSEHLEGTDDLSNVPFTREVSMDTSVVFISQTANYCDWKAAQSDSEHPQSDHSINTKEVYTGLLDSNFVISLSSVDNIAMAEDYVNSDVHMAPLRAVAADDKVKVIFLDQQLEYTRETKDTLVMYMSFKTLSYERWEDAFLDDFREDASHDFEVIRIFRGVEDPDHVHMIFKVNDPEYVEKAEKNNAFRMKMLAAGVVSYPVTYKLSLPSS